MILNLMTLWMRRDGARQLLAAVDKLKEISDDASR